MFGLIFTVIFVQHINVYFWFLFVTPERLSPPCVCDDLGNLFNKERLVEVLLAKQLPVMFSHIRGLKVLYCSTLRDDIGIYLFATFCVIMFKLLSLLFV